MKPVRASLVKRGMRVQQRPGFTTYYDIGVEVSKRLPAHATYEEIGKHFGITKQNAYTEVVLALGKLVFRMREQIKEGILK